MAKMRKKTLRKARPILKASERVGEALGEFAVISKKEAKSKGRKAAKVTTETVNALVKKGKDILRTTTEVVPEMARELKRGVNRGVNRAKKKR